MTSLTKPDPVTDPGYYLLPDESGAPTVAYRCTTMDGDGGSPERCEVVVKAREAGFARYVVTAGQVELYRGATPAGPWELVCDQRYGLQWQDAGGTWRSVAADQLANVTLSVTEGTDHVDVVVVGSVTRPSGRFRLTSRYGVDLAGREFLAEDRFECDGLTMNGASRPLRLVERVVLAQDHDALVDTDDDVDEDGQRRLRKRVGSLRLGWGRHVGLTGDLPRVSVRKAEKTVSVLYHEDGVAALDVDPHVVIDDSNNNILGGTRAIGRTAAGETAIIFADTTTPRVRMAYSTATPPTQTSDWSFVDLAGPGGVIASSCGAFRWATLCLDERSGWLHVLWNDETNDMCYSACDVSSGIGAVATSSNWRKADGSAGYDTLVSSYNDARYKGLVDTNSDGDPFVTFIGSTGVTWGKVGLRKWDGSQWTSTAVVLDSTSGVRYSSTIDADDVIWVFAAYPTASPASVRETHCPFEDAETVGNWSSPVTVLQDDTYDQWFVSCCTDGDGRPYVFGAEMRGTGSNSGWLNWFNGTSWVHGTGSGSGLEKALNNGCQFSPTGGADGAGYAFFVYAYYAYADQRNSKDGFASESGSYGGNPADYEHNAVEHRQLSTDDELYIASGMHSANDIYFNALSTSSGSPWWARARTGGGGSYLTNSGGSSGNRASSTPCGQQRCGPCEQNAKNPTVGANGAMDDAVADGYLSGTLVSEYPGGKCPWDPDDKCHDPELTPY